MKGKKKNETFSEDSAGVNPVEESGKVAETIEENALSGTSLRYSTAKTRLRFSKRSRKSLR